MNKNRQITLPLIAFTIGTLFCLFNSQSARADGETLVAHSQLRRTVDPSPRAAFGTVTEVVGPNGSQIMQVDVRDLGEANFAPFVVEEPSFTTNIVPIFDLPPLDRTGVRKGVWSRTLRIVDFSPFFNNLEELAGNSLDIAQPGTPDVTTIFTNIIGGVTNISLGITNVVGGTTNVINGIVIPNPGQTGEIFTVLWAPLYDLKSQPNKSSYHRNGKLTVVGQASPHASGTVKISFNANTGRSLLEVQAETLTKGQQYTFFVADRTNTDLFVMIAIDNMTQINLGSTAKFLRDTQFADPLPFQARDIGDLSGRVIQIRDAFDYVHLQGVMP